MVPGMFVQVEFVGQVLLTAQLSWSRKRKFYSEQIPWDANIEKSTKQDNINVNIINVNKCFILL